jgi:hypothetical protein
VTQSLSQNRPTQVGLSETDAGGGTGAKDAYDRVPVMSIV